MWQEIYTTTTTATTAAVDESTTTTRVQDSVAGGTTATATTTATTNKSTTTARVQKNPVREIEADSNDMKLVDMKVIYKRACTYIWFFVLGTLYEIAST